MHTRIYLQERSQFNHADRLREGAQNSAANQLPINLPGAPNSDLLFRHYIHTHLYLNTDSFIIATPRWATHGQENTP